MDALLHATRKIMIERATNPQQQPPDSSLSIPDVAPPAYSASPPTPSSCSTYSDDDDESEDDDDDHDNDPSPVTITLDATTTVNGHGNLVATPALADATRFSALLLAAVQSLNAKAEAEAQVAAAAATARADGVEEARVRVRPTLSVQLVLNCGITVTGDRNVVGYRPAAAAATVATAATTTSTTTAGDQSGGLGKRKAEGDSGDAPPCKRIETSE